MAIEVNPALATQLARSGLAPTQVDELILNLVVQRAVDVSHVPGPAN